MCGGGGGGGGVGGAARACSRILSDVVQVDAAAAATEGADEYPWAKFLMGRQTSASSSFFIGGSFVQF